MLENRRRRNRRKLGQQENSVIIFGKQITVLLVLNGIRKPGFNMLMKHEVQKIKITMRVKKKDWSRAQWKIKENRKVID